MKVLYVLAPVSAPDLDDSDDMTAAASFRWLIWEGDEACARGEGLENAASLVPELNVSRTVLVVPGEHALMTSVRVPARQRRQIARALPYVVEEYLADDVEALHLVGGRRDAWGSVPVAAIRPELLEQWLAQLRAAGLEVDTARLDIEALDTPEAGSMEVLVGAGRALARNGASDGFAVDRESLGVILNAWCATRPSGESCVRLRVAADAGSSESLDLTQLDSELARVGEVTLERQAVELGFDDMICRGLHPAASGLELLQHRFAPRRHEHGSWPQWRAVAALAFLWLVVQGGFDFAQARWLSARADALAQRSEVVFRDILPERNRIVAPRREIQALLRNEAGNGDTGFLHMISTLANGMDNVNAQSMELRSLSYARQRGELALGLNTNQLAEVDRLQAALSGAGLQAEIGSATQESSGVRARLRLRPSGGGS